MVINCFDIESCVNAFLEPSSVLLQKEYEQEEKEVFSSVEAENHMPTLAQDMRNEVGGRSVQVFLCCSLQDLEALAQPCLAVGLACALRLWADPLVNLKRWGSLQCNRW